LPSAFKPTSTKEQAMKLDLDDSNVHLVELSVQRARDLIDEFRSRDTILIFALDDAQGDVFDRTLPTTYVVIKITP
jgi:hypothetical protein